MDWSLGFSRTFLWRWGSLPAKQLFPPHPQAASGGSGHGAATQPPLAVVTCAHTESALLGCWPVSKGWGAQWGRGRNPWG